MRVTSNKKWSGVADIETELSSNRFRRLGMIRLIVTIDNGLELFLERKISAFISKINSSKQYG